MTASLSADPVRIPCAAGVLSSARLTPVKRTVHILFIYTYLRIYDYVYICSKPFLSFHLSVPESRRLMEAFIWRAQRGWLRLGLLGAAPKPYLEVDGI